MEAASKGLLPGAEVREHHGQLKDQYPSLKMRRVADMELEHPNVVDHSNDWLAAQDGDHRLWQVDDKGTCQVEHVPTGHTFKRKMTAEHVLGGGRWLPDNVT